MRKRPAVGVTIGYAEEPEMFHLRDDYVRAVEKAGALPLVIVPGSEEHIPALLDRLQALVMTGGADVDPEIYGARRHPTVTRVIRERDDFELALAREALRRDLPLLAICRGHQVLNVATGGTLIQDLPSEWGGVVDHDPDVERWQACHDVEVLSGTRLRQILGADRVAVNSFHHQAVKDLGRGLVVSARCPADQVIEGIEMPDRRFVIGVQWHPESFWDHQPSFQPLFESLVRSVGAAR